MKFYLLALILAIFLFGACGKADSNGSGNTGSAQTATYQTSADIGAAGGAINDPNGNWTLTIPAGALTQTQTIKITTNATSTGNIPEDYTNSGSTLHFEPAGLTFLTNASLKTKYAQGSMTEGGIEEKMLQQYYINDDSSLIAMTSTINMTTNEITAQVPHFSFTASLTTSITRVNNGTTTRPSSVRRTLNKVIAHFNSLANNAARNAEFQANAALLNAFVIKLVQILGSDLLTAAFPNADFDGDGTINSADPIVPINGSNITLTSNGSLFVSTNASAINSTQFVWRSSANGTYSIRLNGTNCTNGTQVASGAVTQNADNTFSPINASALLTGDNEYRICVTTTPGPVTNFLLIVIVRDEVLPVTTASPSGNTFAAAQNVSISCADSGDAACEQTAYTTNGTDPAFDAVGNVTNGTLYTTAWSIPGLGTTTVRVRSRDAAGNLGLIYEASYARLGLSFDIPGGSYGVGQLVTISRNPPTAFVVYTLDGSSPNCASNGSIYYQPVPVKSSATLKARACWDAVSTTELSASYTLPAPAVTTQVGGARHGNPLQLLGAVTTPYGKNYHKDDFGINAEFVGDIQGITTDGTNLYTTNSLYNTIKKISIATGAVTTIAGETGVSGSSDGIGAAAHFYFPAGIVSDGSNLYVSDSVNYTIRKIGLVTGKVTTIAGLAGSAGNTDGIGAAARLGGVTGMAIDGTTIYFTEAVNHTIRKLNLLTGAVVTLAGSPGVSGNSDSTDGTGSTARFNSPNNVAVSGSNLFVVDRNNHTIRKISITTGNVTTLAGFPGTGGSLDGTGVNARFSYPDSIIAQGAFVYVSDTYNCSIRKISTTTGQVTTSAGALATCGSIDGVGNAARFSRPQAITTDGSRLYTSDYNISISPPTQKIRKIDIPSSLVTTIAGGEAACGSAEGVGNSIKLNYPVDLTTDGNYLYVAGGHNHAIRRIELSSGISTTIAGNLGVSGNLDGTGNQALLYFPDHITTDGTTIYFSQSNNHVVRKLVISTGVVTTLAGAYDVQGFSNSTDGTGATARLKNPMGLAIVGSYVYLADGGNHVIRRIDPNTGEVTTIAGTSSAPGSADGTGSVARFQFPGRITTDGTNLYILDIMNYIVRKLVIATNAVTTIAGSAGSSGWADGVGSAARFNGIWGITSDGTNLYISDSSNRVLRKLVLSSGAVSTIAGGVGLSGRHDGSATSARFYSIGGMTTDGKNLYIGEPNICSIRRLE